MLKNILLPVDHQSTYRGVSTKWPMDLCQSIHNSYFHAMRAQNYICIFSHYSSNIDPKSTENPATWRAARMHDFGISICCGQDHRQKKHRIRSFEFCADITVWWAGRVHFLYSVFSAPVHGQSARDLHRGFAYR